MNFDRVTPCGECCDGCPKRARGACSGCLESGGRCEEWAQSAICQVFGCCQSHEVPFCGLCPDFPCDHLPMLRWRPDCVRELSLLAEAFRRQVDER